MKRWIAIFLPVLCLLSGSSLLFADRDSESLLKFTGGLILRKARLQENAGFSVKQHTVELDRAAVSEVRDLLNENAFQSRPIGSLADAQAASDELIARVLEAAKAPRLDPVFWDIKLYNGISRFTESCDEPALSAKPGVEIVTGNGDQYLITGTAMYAYEPSRNVLSVKPLDRMTDSYPVPLDALAFEFNLIGAGVRAFDGMSIVETGASYRAERSDHSQIYLFRAPKEGLISEYFFTQGRHSNFVEKTFGNYFQLTNKMPFAFPSIGASLSVSATGAGVLQMFAVTKASLGKLTDADIPIAVAKDTDISDRLVDPALITHP